MYKFIENAFIVNDNNSSEKIKENSSKSKETDKNN